MNFATFNSNRTRISRLAVLAGCVLAGSLGVAQAADPAFEVPSVVVSYSDLDLSTEDGARALYHRISWAAGKVCPFEDSIEPARVAFSHHCRDEAIARAVHEINNPQLAALVAGRVKRG